MIFIKFLKKENLNREVAFPRSNHFFFQDWKAIKIKHSEILAIQIEKKNNLIKEMKNKKKSKAESFYGS